MSDMQHIESRVSELERRLDDMVERDKRSHLWELSDLAEYVPGHFPKANGVSVELSRTNRTVALVSCSVGLEEVGPVPVGLNEVAGRTKDQAAKVLADKLAEAARAKGNGLRDRFRVADT